MAKRPMTTRAKKSDALPAQPATQPLTFREPGAIAALPDTDLLALFSQIGKAVADRFLVKRPCMNSYTLVVEYLTSQMAHRPTEQFRVLFLDKVNNLIADEMTCEGTIDQVPVYPREVVRRAIEFNATSVILAHNHPSGNLTPSNGDVVMTAKLKEALATIGVTVLDHFIVSRAGYASIRALGLM